MFWLRLLAVGIPLILVMLGMWIGFESSEQNSSADVRGPGEAIGLMLMGLGFGVAVIELLVRLVVLSIS